MQSESDKETIRAFIALPIPESTKKEIGEFAASLKSRFPGAKWVAPENYHITLAFIGDVGSSKIDEIKSIVAAAPGNRFEIRFRGAGVFPNARKARVLWVGMRDGAGECAEISRAISSSLKEAGLPVDEKPFKGHLTIARFKIPAPALIGERDSEAEFSGIVADRISLYRSRLAPRGPEYSELFGRVLG